MKYITHLLIIFLVAITFSNCDCPECFNFWDGERITFLDLEGQNILDPSSGIEIEYFRNEQNSSIDFIQKNYEIDQNSPEGIWHIETVSNIVFNSCSEQYCMLFIKFSHRNQQDTISLSINELNEDCCTNYLTNDFSFNGQLVSMKQETIGGYVITIP